MYTHTKKPTKSHNRFTVLPFGYVSFEWFLGAFADPELH